MTVPAVTARAPRVRFRARSSRARHVTLTVVAVALLLVRPALAQDAADGSAASLRAPEKAADTLTRDTAGVATVHAFRLEAPLTIDGRLDEAVYGFVRPAGGFVQQEPRQGEPATERTEVWVLFDDRTVYVSARCWDQHPERRVANEMRRDHDSIVFNDNFALALDTFRDRRNAFMFHTNPLAAVTDGLSTNLAMNKAWNTVWTVRSARFEGGWTLEMAIPFRSLRYSEGTPTWGIQFRRVVPWKNEVSTLTAVPASYGLPGYLASWLAPALEGIQPPPRSRNLDVKPYAVSSLTTDRLVRPPQHNDAAAALGVDVKYGITRSLTADFTYNTDFAQVENDEQQVNLTRFGLFFPEKREFFLEGAGIFSFGGIAGTNQPADDTPILFFSRRIGLEDGRPVPIRAGGRLTGRAGAYSIGALDIATGDSAAAPTAAHFSVLRLKRDILRRSSVGLIATRRAASAVAADNRVIGLDATLSFYRSINFNTFVASSRTSGIRGRDSSYRTQFDYAADRYGLQLTHLGTGGNFRPEVGFVSRRDVRRSLALARFSPRPAASRLVRKFNVQASLDYVTSWNGRLQSRLAKGTVKVDFLNGNVWTTDVNRHFESLDDPFRIARGVTLPPGAYRFQDVQTSYLTDAKRRLAGTVTLGRGSFYRGTRTNAEYKGRVSFPPRLMLEPTLSFNVVALPVGNFTTKLVGTRTTFAISPRAFIGSLVQYSASAHAFGSNLQFRWEYTPGSELFVVYNEGRDTLLGDRLPELQTRTIVVKITRLFRF